HLRRDRWFAGVLRERPHAALERADFAYDDLDGLIEECPIVRLQARLHFLDRQPDRRQRVLDLVRGLPRERLPAGDLRQLHQALAALAELIGHAVEGIDRASDFIAGGGSRIPAGL